MVNVLKLNFCFTRVVKQLLQREPELVNLLSKEQFSRGPLHITCLLGHLQSVNELLQSVSSNRVAIEEFRLFSSYYFILFINCDFQESCDLKAKDGRGDTALVLALKGSWELVVRRLIYEYEKREQHDEPDVAIEEVSKFKPLGIKEVYYLLHEKKMRNSVP